MKLHNKSFNSVPAIFFCLPGSVFQAGFSWVSRILLPCTLEINWPSIWPVLLPARFSEGLFHAFSDPQGQNLHLLGSWNLEVDLGFIGESGRRH